MSANDWSRCPLCTADALAADPRRDPYDIPETVREDWEIGLDGNRPDDSEILIVYKAECKTCGATAYLDTSVLLVRRS